MTSSSAVTRALGLVAAIVGAVALGPARLGAFAFLTVTATLVASMGVLGSAVLTIQRIADASTIEEGRDTGVFALMATTLSLIVFAGTYFLVSEPQSILRDWLGSPSPGVAAIVACWAIAIGSNQMFAAILTGNKAFKLFAIVSMGRGLCVAASTCFAASLTHSTEWTAFSAVLSESLVAVATLIQVVKKGWISGSPRAGWEVSGRRLLRGALGAGIASLAIMISIWGSQVLLLKTINGYAENGGFSIASRIIAMVTFLPASLSSASLPFMSKRSADYLERRRRIRKMWIGSSFAALSVGTALAIAAPFIMPLLGEGYGQYTDTLIYMCAAAVAMSANNVLSTMAVADDRIRLWIVSDLVLAVVLLAVSALTIPVWRADGLALSYILSYGISAGILSPLLFQEVRNESRQPEVRMV